MFSISEFSRETGVSTQTIRYYERIGLLPEPHRSANGYRLYDDEDISRVRFIKQARFLKFTLDDIREILALREQRQTPCRYVMTTMAKQLKSIEQQIIDLQNLKRELSTLYELGLTMPEDVEMKICVCHLIHNGLAEDES